ncbi:hypothetical protein [Actinokineospora terrae]|uniref:MARVEL domain-containing protein n=1 Tax=Actinokineospora terrae TaxID=155974 RepID=A0A1H9TGB6_9PSEU|nr:hypothetical protein [Actinokineospora terrae]SER96191.1 hypothetical protein SAMN04487818_106264 [Actinokineospora terrae]
MGDDEDQGEVEPVYPLGAAVFAPAPEPPPDQPVARNGRSRPLLSVLAIVCVGVQIAASFGVFTPGSRHSKLDLMFLACLAALALVVNLLAVALLWKSLVESEPWYGFLTVLVALFAVWHGLFLFALVRWGPSPLWSAFDNNRASIAYQAGMTVVYLVLFFANLATSRSSRTGPACPPPRR